MFEVGTKAFVIEKQIAQVGEISSAAHKSLTRQGVPITLNRGKERIGLLKQAQDSPGIL